MHPRVRVIAAVAAACLISLPAQAQTADEIVAFNLKAKGGEEALRATSTVRMSGRVSSRDGEMGMITIAKRPNMVRREQSLGGQTRVTAFDGTRLWMQQNNGPAQEIKGPPADAQKTEEFDSIFLDYRQKGHTITYAGRETVGGRAVHHLRVERQGGAVLHYYIDVETGLESRISTETSAAMGQKGTVDTELSDYRSVDGRVVPFKMRQLVNGAEVAQITFDRVEFNVPVDDAIFRIPAAR